MKTTKHGLARMSQRGLPKRLIDITYECGKVRGDKLTLGRKDAQKLLSAIDKMKQDLLKVIDKGGVTLVMDGDVLITAYNSESFKRRG